jgi:hypothetical protein
MNDYLFGLKFDYYFDERFYILNNRLIINRQGTTMNFRTQIFILETEERYIFAVLQSFVIRMKIHHQIEKQYIDRYNVYKSHTRRL